jgi:hypothetical protein
VLVESTDAGDAKKIFEFVQKTLLIIAGKINCCRSHGESFLVLNPRWEIVFPMDDS